jgi:nickel-dependent lactate racemase
MPTASQIAWTTIAPRDPLRVQLPADLGALTAADAKERALAGAAAFVKRGAAAGVPVLIVVNDPARATPTRWVLEGLAARVPEPSRPKIRLLFATGTHLFPIAEREAFERVTLRDCGLRFEEVAWHDCADASQLATFSLGKDGVKGRVNRRVLDHAFLLAIGSVEPHYFAGATGAHKTLTIGCLAREDIERNHSRAMDPASDLLVLDGNPVFDGIAELAGCLTRSREVQAFNQVALRDSPLAVSCGDWRATLQELLPIVRAVYTHVIAEPCDILHLRVPLPLGRDLYQADKAFKNCHRAVRDGGVIVLEAPCPHGVGPDAFLKLLRRAPDYQTACELVRREGYRLSDHKAVKLRHLVDPQMRGVQVLIRSDGLRPADLSGTGLELLAPGPIEFSRFERSGTRRGLRIEDAGMVCLAAGPEPGVGA